MAFTFLCLTVVYYKFRTRARGRAVPASCPSPRGGGRKRGSLQAGRMPRPHGDRLADRVSSKLAATIHCTIWAPGWQQGQHTYRQGTDSRIQGMVYKGACQGELNDPGQILPMLLQIGGFRLIFVTIKQIESHAKWLATLAGRQDLPWQPILESSFAERGRVSAPGSSDNDRTCAAQGLGPRSAGRARASSNCGVWAANGIEGLSGRSAEQQPWRSFFECVHADLCEWL
jgi:hypothetical protein